MGYISPFVPETNTEIIEHLVRTQNVVVNEFNTYRHTANKNSSDRKPSEDIPICISDPPEDLLTPNEEL